MIRAFVVAALVGLWTYALVAWPDLPERIPTHFDLQGNADAWREPGFGSWFLLPTLATLLGGFTGLVLPPWVVGLARRNSSLLNVPQRERFRELPEPARVRAVASITRGVQWLALTLVAMFGWILFAMERMAHGDWQTMPPFGLFGMVGLVLVQSIWLAISSSRAVRRELEAAR
ncbi:MAG: DUF1648 domain-containing protein [Planctomycetota bacterium]